MAFNVEMPDGTLIEDIPDGTPKEVIQKKWEAMSGSQQKPIAPPRPMDTVDTWSTTAPAPDARSANLPGVGMFGMMGNQIENLAPAFGQGMKEAYQGLRQRGLQLGETLGLNKPGAAESYTSAVNKQRSEFDVLPQSQIPASGVSRFAGNVAPYLALPMAQGFAAGAAMGGVSAASTFDPSGKTPLENPIPIAVSAALGGTLSKIGAAANSPDVLKLKSEGINPSIGQIMGGAVKAAEDKATSVPFLGDMIKSFQRRGVEQLNSAVINRALKPVGKSIPAGVVGREAVDAAEDMLSGSYKELLPNLTAKVDTDFARQINGLKQIVQSSSDDTEKQLAKILNNEIVSKFKKAGGKIDGETFKGIESNLGQISRGIHGNHNSTWDQRLLADAIDEAKTALRALLTRSNPDQATQLQRINKGWANFDRLRRAAAADRGGLGFSPAQLQSAVKAADKSKSNFATGNAMMQDLSDPAVRVLGGAYPDSGTAGRGMQALLANTAAAVPMMAAASPFLALNIPGIRGAVLGASGLRGAPAMIGVGTGKLTNQ